jgi:hypothetical protein
MMKSLNDILKLYRAEMQKGNIPKAYRGIIDYMLMLRTVLRKKYPELSVSGNFYQGYMDMTFFTLVPVTLEGHRLKIALVFNHERISFEAWLSAVNKEVQAEYQNLFRKGTWPDYRIPLSAEGSDSIIECDLSADPDFDHPEILTSQIEKGLWKFIGEVESFLYRTMQ